MAAGADAEQEADALLGEGPPAAELGERLATPDGAEPTLRRSQVAVCVFQRILRCECAEPYDFAACLRRATDRALVPAEFGKARAVLSAFAHAWTLLARGAHGQCALGSADAAEALAFSSVMLSHNLHGSGIGARRVSRSRFVEGCRCLDTARDVPDAMLGALYDDIAEQPLGAALPTDLSAAKMETLDAQSVAKQGWLMVQELDTPLGNAGPWRRRWTRIYEHDVAMFLTPQQWGVDGEIILSLPLHGLVVTSIGDHHPPLSPSSRSQSDACVSAAHSPAAEETPLSQDDDSSRPEPHTLDTGLMSGSSPPFSGPGSGHADGPSSLGSNSAQRKGCFMLCMGSSMLRENVPRLALSAEDTSEPNRCPCGRVGCRVGVLSGCAHARWTLCTHVRANIRTQELTINACASRVKLCSCDPRASAKDRRSLR